MQRSRRKSYSRTDRVAELIQTALATILQKEKSDAQANLITVTEVKVSPDFSFAKIFISVLREESAKDVIHALNEKSKYFRYELAHEVKLRTIPDLRFFYDDSAVRGQRISAIIEQLK